MKRSQSITSKLKNTNVEIKNYLLELEKEISRLQKINARLQVKNISQQAEISGLKKAKPQMIVRVTNYAKNNNNNHLG